MDDARETRPATRYDGLDQWSTADVVAAILATQIEALQRLERSLNAFAAPVSAMAEALRAGGRVAFAGAGSSGAIAHIDALELPGTYGIPADRVPTILAGGPGALLSFPGQAEDDGAAAEHAVDALALEPGDCLVAVAASGRTPFTLAAQRHAKHRGAATIAIACVAGSPLLLESDFPILAESPPEVVSGSTRMAAGTAQKCALNALTTGVAVRLGHAYRGLMVNMRSDNAKLRERAVGIVVAASGVGSTVARQALVEADWSIKTAIVACSASVGLDEARKRLGASDGNVRTALEKTSPA